IKQVQFNNDIGSGRWLEAVVRDDDTGTYYGYYHNEPGGVCADNNKTAPKIGAVRSRDQGRTWEDLGIIMEGMGLLNCQTANHYFVGGHGDFSVMLDQEKRYLYFFFSSYEDEWDQQGVSAAVMEWKHRDQPKGAVYKYWGREGESKSFNQPGLKGAVSPLNAHFGIRASWHDLHADAFWGPSVHWNTHLQMYVMLLNRAVKADETWRQDGIYASFSPALEDPSQWSEPVRIVEGGTWYPQIIGAQPGWGTDKVSGCKAFFFQGGVSKTMFYFIRPGETRPCTE
ncbi:MAG TPA: hypothetical protein VFV50_11700, partial [Bdellovibrionales bacterium]|nr:hypothetical protein [Bdellovibrionales bacterium]